jgi:hypothetical protein
MDFKLEKLLKLRFGDRYREFIKSLKSQESFENFLLNFLISKSGIKIVKDDASERNRRQFILELGRLKRRGDDE